MLFRRQKRNSVSRRWWLSKEQSLLVVHLYQPDGFKLEVFELLYGKLARRLLILVEGAVAVEVAVVEVAVVEVAVVDVDSLMAGNVTSQKEG